MSEEQREDATPVSKRTYHAPELRELGSMLDLTQASGTPVALDSPYSAGSI